MLAYLISHILIRPVEKINFSNFHVFDIHYLYKTSRYAIVKFDVIERIGVTKRHSIVIIIWQTSAIDVHYQKHTYINEKYTRKNIYYGCEGQLEKSVLRDHSLTSLDKPRDARQTPSGRSFLFTPHTHE